MLNKRRIVQKILKRMAGMTMKKQRREETMNYLSAISSVARFIGLSLFMVVRVCSLPACVGTVSLPVSSELQLCLYNISRMTGYKKICRSTDAMHVIWGYILEFRFKPHCRCVAMNSPREARRRKPLGLDFQCFRMLGVFFE
jgi:hypothetical protein